MSRIIKARGIVKGAASGPALICREAVSFLGDIDINTGVIVGKLPSVEGQCVKGTVMVMPDSMGSAGAWRFLYQLYTHGNHPAAIISVALPDPSLVQGAILAGIPVLTAPEEDVLAVLTNENTLRVDGAKGVVYVD